MEARSSGGSWDPAYERKAIILLAIGFGLVGLDRNIIAPLFPVMVEDLGLSYQDLGAIAGILAIFWGVFSIVAGGLSDRIGRRKVLIPAVIAFSLAAGFTGLATGLGSLLMLRALMGVLEGAYTPTSFAHTSESSKPSRRGLNMGFQQCLFPLLGLGLGPIVATQLLGIVPSWRWVFVIVALPGLVVAYLLYRVLRDPAHINRRSVSVASGTEQGGEPHRWREIFRFRNVIVATLAIFGVFSCLFVIAALTPNYLTDYLGLSVPQMGFVISAIGFGGFVGQLLVPGLSDRLGRKPVLVGALIVDILFLLLFAITGANPVMLFVWLFVVALSTFSALSMLTGPVITEAVPPPLIASAAGVPIGISEIFGGGIAPIVAGFAAQNYGIQSTLYVALIGLAMAFAFSFLVIETAPSKTGEPDPDESAATPSF